MTIANNLSQSVVIRGRLVEPGLYIDPASGLPTIAKSSFIAFFTDDVSSISANIVEERFEGWSASFTTPGGEVKNGRMVEPIINRTLGYVQSHLMRKS